MYVSSNLKKNDNRNKQQATNDNEFWAKFLFF